MIPVDKAILVVESFKDIVIRFNGDLYRGRSRSVPSQKRHKSAKCWTLENVSFSSPPPRQRSQIHRTGQSKGNPAIWQSGVLWVFVGFKSIWSNCQSGGNPAVRNLVSHVQSGLMSNLAVCWDIPNLVPFPIWRVCWFFKKKLSQGGAAAGAFFFFFQEHVFGFKKS